VAVALAAASVLLFGALSLWVELMSHSANTSATAVNIGIVPAAIALVSIALGWIAFAARKDHAWLLLIVTLAVSLQALFVLGFEILEVVL